MVDALWQWVRQAGGCAALTRGECVCGASDLPAGKRWTVSGAPLRRSQRVRVTGVPVVPNLQKDIKAIQHELGLIQYNFPF